jgi:hypothetical protein
MIIAGLLLAVAAPGAADPTAEPQGRSTSVKWQVSKRGQVTSCTVVATSGDPKIDHKACELVVRTRPKQSGTATIPAEGPHDRED